MSKSSCSGRIAWNQGKIIGQKPPLKIKEVWAIRVRLQLAERSRDLALVNLAKLRGCDVVKAGVEDLLLSLGHAKSESTVRYLGIEVEDAWSSQCRVEGWFDHVARNSAPILSASSWSTRNSCRSIILT